MSVTRNAPGVAATAVASGALAGVNDEGIVVGFYNDANGNSHGYEYNIWTRQFSMVVDPSDPGASLTAAAINDHGDVTGFYTNPATGNTDGFLATP